MPGKHRYRPRPHLTVRLRRRLLQWLHPSWLACCRSMARGLSIPECCSFGYVAWQDIRHRRRRAVNAEAGSRIVGIGLESRLACLMEPRLLAAPGPEGQASGGICRCLHLGTWDDLPAPGTGKGFIMCLLASLASRFPAGRKPTMPP